MNAESLQSGKVCENTWCASMRPRPNERGKQTENQASRHRRRASMRPRPNERGKDVFFVIIVNPYSFASMRPRPNERGKTRLGTVTTSVVRCFNEAAS